MFVDEQGFYVFRRREMYRSERTTRKDQAEQAADIGTDECASLQQTMIQQNRHRMYEAPREQKQPEVAKPESFAALTMAQEEISTLVSKVRKLFCSGSAQADPNFVHMRDTLSYATKLMRSVDDIMVGVRDQILEDTVQAALVKCRGILPHLEQRSTPSKPRATGRKKATT